MLQRSRANPSAPLLVAGGGIGGMAAALVAAQAGWPVQLFERAPAFEEVGAGVQLGPNATRILLRWGLQHPLDELAARPRRVVARSAGSGAILGSMPLGADMTRRYGAPYLTVHRADLHAMLYRTAVASGAQVYAGALISGFSQDGAGVSLQLADQDDVPGAALVGADGLHSTVRRQLLADGEPPLAGDCAWRSLLDPAAIPPAARAMEVTAWLGPGWHAVQYPVRGGRAMNFVVLLHGAQYLRRDDAEDGAAVVGNALRGSCTVLLDLVAAVPSASLNVQAWRKWPLAARAPVVGADQMARGRVALLGDAAHPMRPYLAQGAGMALEDADELGWVLMTNARSDMPGALQHYARKRWARCARVQARSMHNGRIFRACGPLRLARDAALRTLSPRLMDMPWLYGHGRA